jgi:hypothetical protein
MRSYSIILILLVIVFLILIFLLILLLFGGAVGHPPVPGAGNDSSLLPRSVKEPCGARSAGDGLGNQ